VKRNVCGNQRGGIAMKCVNGAMVLPNDVGPCSTCTGAVIRINFARQAISAIVLHGCFDFTRYRVNLKLLFRDWHHCH
jgi:hypothetical protein